MSVVLVPKIAFDSMTTLDQDALRYAFPEVELRFDTAPTVETDMGVACYIFSDPRLPPEPAPKEA